MAEVTATMVKELRDRTGVGMMECRKALVEANGDVDQAIKFLRERGISKAESRSSRTTKEGLIFSYIHFNGKLGVLLELNCESDFVARTDEFKALAEEIAMQIVASNPLAVSGDDIDEEIIAREAEIARNKAINDGKKPELVDRIVEGSIKKFRSENALLDQELLSDEKRTIKDLLTDSIAKTGENIQISRFVRYALGE
ncbi:MAG: translation elongation factor Ts [Candidatus Cloacimonetes bacterium]|jgi:elongation factor Ts|nr:translation elongation factor Ts [Candidatus Cloacimonadota bacterium]NLO44653.1 translation elongation factor Ts [Candidatus Cloacimonadota bacterium]